MTLEGLKARWGITDSAQDAALQLLLDDVTATLKVLTGRDPLPDGIDWLVYDAAKKTKEIMGMGTADVPLPITAVADNHLKVEYGGKTYSGSRTYASTADLLNAMFGSAIRRVRKMKTW